MSSTLVTGNRVFSSGDRGSLSIPDLDKRVPRSDAELLLRLELVAQAVGEGVTGHEVDEVITFANDYGVLFHGIKRAKYVPAIKEQGILPLSPEGGPGSFWASGERVFFSSHPVSDSPMWMFDTPFFHYGSSYNSGGPTVMAFAVTDGNRLSSNGIYPDLAPNAHCVITEPVNPSLLTIVTAESADRRDLKSAMFQFLLEAVRSGQLLESALHELQF